MNRKRFKTIAVGVVAACICGVLALRMASATPNVGLTTTIVSGPTRLEEVHLNTHNVPLDHAFRLKTKGPSDVYVVYNILAPGGHTGWHSHPGPSIISVRSGVATGYDSDAPGVPHVYPAGTSFIDDGEGAHLVRNEGNVNLELVAFQVLPAGAPRRIDEPAP